MFLKLESLLHNMTSAGKLFQVTGAVHENERLANTVIILGTVSSERAAHVDGQARITPVHCVAFSRGRGMLRLFRHNKRRSLYPSVLTVDGFKNSEPMCY